MRARSHRLEKLKHRLISVALSSPEFKEELELACQEIASEAKRAENEASVEGAFERVLYSVLLPIGIRFHPEKEVLLESRRHTGKGRMDSRIGAVVIEYKHRSKLKTATQISAAQQQIEEYIRSLSRDIENEVVGFLTDGLHLLEMRSSSGEIASRSGKRKMSARSLLLVVRSIVALETSALTSQNLIRDFCAGPNGGVLYELARILNETLCERPTDKTGMLRSEWEELFRLAHEDRSQQRRIQERREALAQVVGVSLCNAASEYRALFALHTAYAIVLKLLACRILSDVRFGSALYDYKSLIGTQSEVLRAFCWSLEEGEVFRQLGFLNLLEGDFFSWYCDKKQWSGELANALQNIIEILSRYEDVSNIFRSADAIDLFRELYEAAVPHVVRASFGEFYTPFWLAQHVLRSSRPTGRWTALDPCCGSGTFVIAAISEIRGQNKTASKDKLLNEILSRVSAIDLNPLAVLTTRVHYFIHIADLLPDNPTKIVIPVFLGDATYVPERVIISGVKCLKYQLRTLKTPISVELPMCLVENTARFVELMQQYEHLVRRKQSNEPYRFLLRNVSPTDRVEEIAKRLMELTVQLVALENKGWNGIWARIITNFLTTACLAKHTNIIGNPPWIDWKNLPAGYREKVKSLCIDKGLFSGAGRTGGINLNICALIAHVAASNWLTREGILAFLMPRELAYQASYEGWRLSVGGPRRDLLEFHDWSRAGHPFASSKEDFMTFVLGPKKKTAGRPNTVPVYQYVRKEGRTSRASVWRDLQEANSCLNPKRSVAGQIIPGSSAYTVVKRKDKLDAFSMIAGECAYIGREGIEFYPQELFIFEYVKQGPRRGTAFFKNIQVSKSKYKIPSQRIPLETRYLHPLVKGPAISPFYHDYKGLIVPFAYEKEEPHRPVSAKRLEEVSPLLLEYFRKFEGVIRSQTKFSDKIRGPNAGEFYGLARTGRYSFHDVYVTFRDNTKWTAAVVTTTTMPWAENKRFVFQNHAVSICERKDGTGYTDLDEAHYLCAILNAPIVQEFIYATSDTRSFKIRPPIFVPRYRAQDDSHKSLSRLSYMAHSSPRNREAIRQQIQQVYLRLCRARLNH